MSAVASDLTAIQAELMRRDLYKFTREAWNVFDPADFLPSWHLDVICEHLTWVSTGDITRLIISMPPRMTKSLTTGVTWPVWSWTNDPRLQFLTGSYDLSLSTRDALKSRRLIESHWFQERYGDQFKIRDDENMKSRYSNEDGGHRIAITAAGKTTGEGGDIILLDDPHNARDVYSDVKRLNVLEWYDNAMRSRLNNQNTGRIVLVGQRTHDMDLIGHVVKKEGTVGVLERGRWVHLVLPNEYRVAKTISTYLPKEIRKFEEEEKKDIEYEPKPLFTDPRSEDGQLLCDNRLGKDPTQELKNAMTLRDYNSQYQQDPAADDGLILKRSFWQKWEYPDWHPEYGHRKPMPKVDMIVQFYDTAFEEKEEADYSARTTWGIFSHVSERRHPKTGIILPTKERRCGILLEAWRDKVASYDLRREAIEAYNEFDPDFVFVEKKASGHGLIQELRKAGVRVKAIDPGGRDKVARAHVAVLPLEQGCIFYVPGHVEGEEVIDECARFPMAANDDWTDTAVMAFAYLRKLGNLEYFDEDDEDSVNLFKPRRTRGIYG